MALKPNISAILRWRVRKIANAGQIKPMVGRVEKENLTESNTPKPNTSNYIELIYSSE